MPRVQTILMAGAFLLAMSSVVLSVKTNATLREANALLIAANAQLIQALKAKP